MENFESKLEKLEELSDKIKQNDISLEEALSIFEQGIKLSKGMEKDIERIENKVQILMNNPVAEKNEKPQLDFFADFGVEE
ncbi:MAG: exodeoxyribonuclease VII small subunit [Treponemataceae bacterium]